MQRQSPRVTDTLRQILRPTTLWPRTWRRRALALILLGVLTPITLVLTGLTAHPGVMDSPAWYLLLPLIFTLYAVPRGLRDPHTPCDEYHSREYEQAQLTTYHRFPLLIVLLALYLLTAHRQHWPVPQSTLDWTSFVSLPLSAVITLPTLLIAWNRPDPPPEQDDD